MGQTCVLYAASAILILGCILCAGCTQFLTAEGPLTHFVLSNRNATAGALTTAPTPPATAQTASVPPTAPPEPSSSPERPVTPAGPPESYQPLRVILASPDEAEFRTFTFRYRTDDYTLNVPLNASLLRAANTSPNKQIVVDDKEFRLFYQQMVADPAMEPFYRDLLAELQKLRYKGGKTLTDDEYLEMIVSFVQQIPYDTTSTGVRYPVEVIYDQMGDCDEKSMLLTGLLSRERYDVGLLLFPSLRHATAGIRIHLNTNNPSFRVFSDGTRDYIYIETTTTRLIGFYPDNFKNASQPVIIPVGSGTLNYGKINYVMKIFYDLGTIQTNIKTLSERAKANNNALQEWDYNTYVSYVNTYNFVLSTNDCEAAMEAIRESELPHHSSCMSCN